MSYFWSGQPYFIFVMPIQFQHMQFSYSTLDEYGVGWLALPEGKVVDVRQWWDVEAESDGKAELFDIAYSENYATTLWSGGVSIVGALDNYGLVYEDLQVAQSSP